MTRLLGGFLLLLGATTGSLLAGCDSAADPTPAAEVTAQQIRSEYRETLVSVGQYAADNGLAYDSPEAFAAGTRARFAATYGEDSDEYRALNASLSAGSASPVMRRGADDLPEYLQETVLLVDEALDTSETLGEVSNRIDSITDAIESKDWTSAEKQVAITYAVMLDETTRYVVEHEYSDEIPPGGSVDNLRMGPGIRCAGGILSEGIAGGLAGAGVGSTIPIIGTFWGGALGAAAGALHGAVTYC